MAIGENADLLINLKPDINFVFSLSVGDTITNGIFHANFYYN